MHFLGLAGMPRRIPDYPDTHWTWNYYSSVGSLITVVGLIVFFFLLYNMLYLNTLGIQFKNKIYILFSINSSNQNLYRLLKNYEYNLNAVIYIYLLNNLLLINIYKNFIYLIYIYLYKILLEFINIFIINFLFKKKIYIYIKYNFIYFFEKCKMYIYIEKFFYIIFLNKILTLYNNLNIIKLIEIFSYKYLKIFIYLLNYKNININIQYNYLILNRYLYKYINNIFINIYYFVYNIEMIKKYI